MIYKTLHRKLKIEQHEPYYNKSKPKEDKTDLWLSMIASFDRVVAWYS